MGRDEMKQLAVALESVASELPETIGLEDIQRDRWLMRIVLAADDIANRIERQALFWAKTQ